MRQLFARVSRFWYGAVFLSITTAGYDRHSICWEQHEYAKRVIEGTLPDEAFFGYIRAAEDDDDWTDPAIWKKANPSFDVTVSAEAIAEDCREAQESPAKENALRRYCQRSLKTGH